MFSEEEIRKETQRLKKIKYNKKRNKDLIKKNAIKKFQCNLKERDYNEIDEYLKKNNLNKVSFLKLAIETLKKAK